MKKLSTVWLSALALMFTFSSCAVVGGIFKAGVWVGIIIVVFVVVLILWLVNRGRG
ncbi:phosphatidate cytidylyltransferase [Flavisolibacter ginsenosidimutans]|uniref:Phosphatidate cytidylyltransferase n=1 Tax=Flavisolibacter ginsenosidimutans TaxID=661481 RepID=A0A5B8UHD2_9BACT|nr:phosphatidate cytidylyltransferase [Flavisolibacter ginsenosidimutans]QEC55822.1 phosphatidate cytidylyltransferase [Flavisolibacter ginsenosidimutans]